MTSVVRELHGAWNFRDVADTATALRPGRLFRSSELTRLDDEGQQGMRRLGITDVVDLRSTREVQHRGTGRVPAGVEVHLLPLTDLPADPTATDGESPHEHAWQRMLTEKPDDESVADVAARYMVDEYRRFPTFNGSQRALRQVVTLLASGHAVLAHCFAGKDRTGFLVAAVLEAVGVDRDAIVADYLRSNDAAPQLRERIREMIQQRPRTEVTAEVLSFTEARLSDEVLGVRAEYLAAARRSIDEGYGSLDGYLRSAGVSAADVDRLRRALLG